jgi:hypothetical protein
MDADFVAGPTGANPGEPHPPPERLAALADELPTPTEEFHLASCPECASEVESYRSLLALTRAERDRLAEPLTNWQSLSDALTAETLLTAPDRGHRPPAALPRLRAWATRSAAAVVLVAGGVVVGRFSVHADKPVNNNDQTTTAAVSDIKTPASDDNGATQGQFTASAQKFASADDALAAVLNAETIYRHAVAYLMVSDSADKGTGIPNDYATRLAALDEVARTTRAALFAAPHDVVLRRVYLNSVDAREATLRELGQTIPASLHGGQY